jgi:quinol monooxygenase YgiN
MPIRAIINLTYPTPEAAEAELKVRIERCRQTEAEEEGCLQFEIFRSAMKPEKLVLCELWASEEAFDRHWRLGRSGTRPPNPSTPGRAMSAEFYLQKIYAQADGVWAPAEAARRLEGIRW